MGPYDLLDFWPANLARLQGAEIIFIDNGSALGGQQQLSSFCAQHGIRLLRNEHNRGYAAANNQGAAIASGEYLLFLNNDVEILKPPIAYLCAQAGDGIAGPGPLQTETGELCVEGWALCIAASTFAAIAGWCEDYGPGYWDDVDLCFRARRRGYPIAYLEDFVSDHWTSFTSDARRRAAWIRHLGGTTGTDGRLDHRTLNQTNHRHFTRKFYPYLRDLNVMIFPDWQQPETALYQTLTSAIAAFLQHPDQAQMSLLIDPGDAGADAEFIAASALMEVLLAVALEQEPAITVLDLSDPIDWLPVHHRLTARLRLPQENPRVAWVHDRAAYAPAEFAQVRLSANPRFTATP